MAEQLFCKQWAGGSIPLSGSRVYKFTNQREFYLKLSRIRKLEIIGE